ncbi:cyanoglobin [Geminocystis sp. NIES-3708]|uniref:group I truncated hemoglobin n=1 Tax=Geminocystis sp. NIES-3708 TaxID=1615909 RepID=UPI0005FC9FA4|nr:group 1 truncated hemoglobin [Geminocystis sp. NIES-3708]BAQ61606.1 cyanoglobin [Geminocystis sp. NIES-3708]
MTTLYEKLGGKEAVNVAVDIFYDKVLKDDRVKDFFVNTDMVKQKAHQKAFMTYAFGGSDGFDGNEMRKAHQELVANKGLTDIHFDAIAENLVITLQELKVAPDIIDEVVKIVGSVQHRNDVLNR